MTCMTHDTRHMTHGMARATSFGMAWHMTWHDTRHLFVTPEICRFSPVSHNIQYFMQKKNKFPILGGPCIIYSLPSTCLLMNTGGEIYNRYPCTSKPKRLVFLFLCVVCVSMVCGVRVWWVSCVVCGVCMCVCACMVWVVWCVRVCALPATRTSEPRRLGGVRCVRCARGVCVYGVWCACVVCVVCGACRVYVCVCVCGVSGVCGVRCVCLTRHENQ